MFLIMINYQENLELIDKHLAAHRAYLDECYRNLLFILSGPRNPRTGGVIVSPLRDYDQLIGIIKLDPFYTLDLAEYEIVEFLPNRSHPKLTEFIDVV